MCFISSIPSICTMCIKYSREYGMLIVCRVDRRMRLDCKLKVECDRTRISGIYSGGNIHDYIRIGLEYREIPNIYSGKYISDDLYNLPYIPSQPCRSCYHKIITSSIQRMVEEQESLSTYSYIDQYYNNDYLLSNSPDRNSIRDSTYELRMVRQQPIILRYAPTGLLQLSTEKMMKIRESSNYGHTYIPVGTDETGLKVTLCSDNILLPVKNSDHVLSLHNNHINVAHVSPCMYQPYNSSNYYKRCTQYHSDNTIYNLHSIPLQQTFPCNISNDYFQYVERCRTIERRKNLSHQKYTSHTTFLDRPVPSYPSFSNLRSNMDVDFYQSNQLLPITTDEFNSRYVIYCLPS